MSKERFQSTGKTSFYGDYLYEQIIPPNHLLRKLREVVPWQRFTNRLLEYYKGKARVGRPPYGPAVLLKMLLLAYLYDLSEGMTIPTTTSYCRPGVFAAPST